MNKVQKSKILLTIFFTIVLVIFILVYFINKKDSNKVQQQRLSLIGNIQFKGHVIKSKIYEYAGKNYYLICVKLDSSNTKNAYVYNNICAIKISNQIATFSAGVFDPAFGPVQYVEANLNLNNKLIFHYKNSYVDTSALVIANSGLTKTDLDICN